MRSRSILITGGSGSFGRAFVRSLLADEEPPGKIIVFSRGEHRQESMERAFADIDTRKIVRYFIGDVRDRDRLELAMEGVDTVVHAAALKVVPKCEIDPSEAMKTNVLGADNVIHAALRSGVERVIGISTDKAVAPVNLYGATKLVAEKLFLAANTYTKRTGYPRFAVIRYGNVSGSRGSVIPLWKGQIARGEEIVITDPDATRFWITLSKAVFDVTWLMENMIGGELFVPHMRAYRVGDLAEAMMGVVGYPPGEPFHGTVTGLRPGEKLHETIISSDELAGFIEMDRGVIRNPLSSHLEGAQLTQPMSSDLASRIPVKELAGMVEALRG